VIATAVELRDLRPGDCPEIARIYAEGIATGNATVETEVPSWDAWNAAHLVEHRFVAVADGCVVGWVALSPTSPRPCYAVVEVTAYVAAGARGRGVGAALLERLIASAEAAGI
jgi:phosphinothricin acetyltransferase